MSKIMKPSINLMATFGTLLEWAEYTFFAYMADQLSLLFFAAEEGGLARLKTFAIFATSYFMRPFGAILFGTLGDKFGRKPALMISMVLMGCATMSMGCLPTYSDIGAMAAYFLLACRLLQGLAVSGEFHAAITFLHEHAERRPFWVGCFGPFAAASGMAIGAFAATLTLLPGAPHWSWRIPFLCSGVLCIIALYLRSNMSETPAFQNAKKHHQLAAFPLLKALQQNRKGIWMSAGISLFIAVYVYIGNVYFKILAIKTGGLAPATAAQIITFGQTMAAICILSAGRLADRWDGKKMCQLGLGLAIISGPFILGAAQTGNIGLTLLGQLLFAVINGLVSAPMMTLLMRLFETETRYSGSAMGWSLSAAIFGGTALMVADIMITQFEFSLGPGLYISLAASIALFMLLRLDASSKPLPRSLKFSRSWI